MRHNLLAMSAIMALSGAGGMLEIAEPLALEPPVKRRRNYDIEGPEQKAFPPSARDAELPMTRQQRRWHERQSKKGGKQ